MGEIILEFPRTVGAPDGRQYHAHIAGSQMPDGMWHGWVEFVPVDDGEPIRSARETTQPNRGDLVYWATGLTDVYLEGALQRTLEGPKVARVERPQASIFPGPASSVVPGSPRPEPGSGAAILDPFSVYEKGEALLRRQLGAMSAWHLVNIALEYDLTDLDVETLNAMPAADLIELIVSAVRLQAERPKV